MNVAESVAFGELCGAKLLPGSRIVSLEINRAGNAVERGWDLVVKGLELKGCDICASDALSALRKAKEPSFLLLLWSGFFLSQAFLLWWFGQHPVPIMFP